MSQQICKFAFSLLSLAVFAPVRAQSYRLTDLGNLGYPGSYVSGLNASSQVVGFSTYDSAGDFYAFLFAGGGLTSLGALGGADSYGYAINSGGQVVGTAMTSGGVADAFSYSGGALKNLGALGGSFSDAFGVNDAGQIVGDAALAGDLTQHAYLYTNGTMMDLGTLGGNTSTADGINASGQVVGVADTILPGVSHAFLYSGSGMQDLGTLGGVFSTASAINASGQIVGASTTLGELSELAFLYSGGTMQNLGTLGGDYSFADAINASGEVVGTADLAGDVAADGFIYSQGVMYDLNSLVDSSGADYSINEGFGINDRGFIAADASAPDGSARAVLLIPYFTDAPTSYSLYRGVYVSGSVASLSAVDGNDLVLRAGAVLISSEPPASVIIDGTSSEPTPSDLRLSLTAHTNTGNLLQTVELWDYKTSSWVLFASQAATTSLSTQVAISTSPGNYVQPGTNAISARISWKPTGSVLIYPWTVSIDQAVWNVSP